jgi:hypothetical protein
VRMNLVHNGRLCEVVSLRSSTIEQEIGAALARLSAQTAKAPGGSTAPLFVAVPQRELDTLLAVRRWFHEGTTGMKIPLPAALGHGDTGPLTTRLVTEAFRILSSEPAAREAQPVG